MTPRDRVLGFVVAPRSFTRTDVNRKTTKAVTVLTVTGKRRSLVPVAVNFRSWKWKTH